MSDKTTLSKNLRRKLVTGVASLLLFISTGSALYYYSQYRSLQKNSINTSQQQDDALLTKAGKLILLPTNETPSIAKVTDKSKLSNEQFFKNAQNGDWIIIYLKAKQAVIYRESTNQIIGVGPVTST